MNWWNISVFGIIPAFSVGIVFCSQKKHLWITPFISLVLSCLISVVLTSIITIAVMPSILSDYEHRALFFLCLMLQFIIILVLTIVRFVITYILNKKNKK